MTDSFNNDDLNVFHTSNIRNILNEIENNNFDHAFELTKKLVEKYPNYSTLQFLQARTLIGMKKNIEAKEAIRFGNELLGCESTLEYYMNLVPFEEVEEPQVEAEIENDLDLTELADKLSTAKMDISDGNDEAISGNIDHQPIPPEKSLVSETLARIYFSQENYKEAKEIYETLIEIQPEREEYYQKKLDEINTRMNPPS